MKLDYKKMYQDCFDAVKDKMGDWPGGDTDGVFFFLPRPFEVEIDKKKDKPITSRLELTEKVCGVFYSFNRIVPSDRIIFDRVGNTMSSLFPIGSEDILPKLLEKIEEQKRKHGLFPVLLKEVGDGVYSIPRGMTSTRLINCNFDRISSVAAQMSHCRVYH